MIGLQSKYGFEFDEESLKQSVRRLTDQTWKLIPMYENEEDWEKQLNTVIIEIAGLKDIFLQNPQFLQLLAKLEGLKEFNGDFFIYRKTVFEAISLLQGVIK